MKRKSTHKWTLLILFVFIITFFIFSVSLRQPWMGVFSESGHQWVTGHSLLVSRQWYFEGPSKFKFGLPWNPPSIEFPNIQSREIYSSFPSGIIWPIYLISKFLRHQPNITMLMRYNLINHLLVTITLASISYLILFKNGLSKTKSMFISCFTSIVVLFSSGPFYWFQNTYFTQEAIILPFCLIILIETLKIYQILKFQRIINIIESFIIFYALYTDWLSVFVIFIMFINNVLSKRQKFKEILRNNLHLIIPSILFVSFFIYQALYFSELNTLIDKFLFRTATNSSGKGYITNFFNQFWIGHALPAFSITSLIFLFILVTSFIFCGIHLLFNKKNIQNKTKLFFWANLILIPNLLEIYTLKNHSAIHNFTTLKLVIPISLAIPFIFSFIKLWFKKDMSNISISGLSLSTKNKSFPVNIPIFFLPIIIFGVYLIKNPQKFIYFPEPNYLFNDISEFIRKNTNENEIVFSPNFQIPILPPQRLSLSLKRIYYIENISQIKEKIKNIKSKDVVVDIFILGKSYPDKDIQSLISSAYETKSMLVNGNQKNTVAVDLSQNIKETESPDSRKKAINSIYQWNDNYIYLYKIKL